MLLLCNRLLNNQILPHKYVRLKSSVTFSQFKTSKDIRKQRIKNISEYLGCNILTAQEITVKNQNIFLLDHCDLDRNVKFCKKVLKISDLVEFPSILSFNSSLLQHRYYSLKELGFSRVTASDILKFPYILKKTPKELRKEGLCFSDEKFDSLTKYLDDREKAEITSRLLEMYYDGSDLRKIKEIMNAEFLNAKLGCSIARAQHMLHSYPPLRVQSILNTDQLLNILLKKFGFSHTKIYNSLNLLSLHPETVDNFLTQVPEVLGISLVHLVNKQPLLLRKPIDSILKIETVLKEFNITEAQLMCCPKVIVFSPNTLRERLAALCNSKDLSLLKSYKKFLWLAYYYNNLNSRLETLKELDIPCSISMFTVSKSNFSKYLCVSECRTHIKDICFYLSEMFNIEEKEIILRLREYPNYQNSSLLNCRKVVEFLLKSGVTKKQIFNGIGIIFYDADVVKLYFKDLKNHAECQPYEEWIMHYNLIQLLIYVIEVDTGFQGSRVYKAKGKIDEQDELLFNVSSN